MAEAPTGPPNNPQAHLCWRFFDCMIDMGGKVWVDLNCKLMHLGQHLFTGDLAESLRVQGRW